MTFITPRHYPTEQPVKETICMHTNVNAIIFAQQSNMLSEKCLVLSSKKVKSVCKTIPVFYDVTVFGEDFPFHK